MLYLSIDCFTECFRLFCLITFCLVFATLCVCMSVVVCFVYNVLSAFLNISFHAFLPLIVR